MNRILIFGIAVFSIAISNTLIHAQSSLLGISYRNFLDGSGANGISVEYGRKYSFGWIFANLATFDHSIDITYPGGYPGGGSETFTYPKDNPPNEETLAEFQKGLAADQAYNHVSRNFTYTPLGFFGALSISPCFQLSEGFLIGPTVGIFVGKGDEVGTADGNPSVIPISDLILWPNYGGTLKISFARTPKSLWLLLDYGTHTGAGLGIAMPL